MLPKFVKRLRIRPPAWAALALGAISLGAFTLGAVPLVSRRAHAQDAGAFAPSPVASAPPGVTFAPAPLQLDAQGDPILVPPAAAEVAALRPLALRGAAVLVRDADLGARARVTVLVRSRALLATVHRVIVTPEHYTTFMPLISSVDILSRAPRRVGFRFHVRAAFFDVSSTSALHDVSERRIDVAIVQSDIGPGASRWDLFPDADGTLVALTTWGDPSRGTWILRQVAGRSPSAIAAMNISTDVLLALSAARRAENLSGRALPVRPASRSVPSGPLAPPPPGDWLQLTRAGVVASISLDAQGAVQQSTVAAYTAQAPAVVAARLDHVAGYPAIWRAMRRSEVRGSSGNVVTFHVTTETALAHAEGDVDRESIASPTGRTVWWRGRSGDYRGHEHRWDVAPVAGGSVVTFTGGAEENRLAFATRALIDREPWLMPGFSASWKLLWLRALLAGL